ncbi:hypothetical protein GCM10027418_01560 [Mariniluteicoccus endophyticus]
MSNTHDTPHGDDRKEIAKEHAADLKDHAVGAGQDLGQQAKAEALGVAHDAKAEARGLMDTVLGETRSQVRGGQSRIAEGVRAFAAEVGEMADGGQHQGQASQVARTLSSRGEDVARWLEANEPEDMLQSVKRYAARNPMTFLAIAAGAGLLVGRFARGFQAEASDDRDDPRGFYGRDARFERGYDPRGYDRSFGYEDSYRSDSQGGYPQAGYERQASSFDRPAAAPGYQAEPGAQGQAWHHQGDAYGDQAPGFGDRR